LFWISGGGGGGEGKDDGRCGLEPSMGAFVIEFLLELIVRAGGALLWLALQASWRWTRGLARGTK
jgi:hypothetical protein